MNEVLQRLINDGLRALMMPSFSYLNTQVFFVSVLRMVVKQT